MTTHKKSSEESLPKYVKDIKRSAKNAKTPAEARKVVTDAEKLTASPWLTRRKYGWLILGSIAGVGLATYKLRGGKFVDLPDTTRRVFTGFGMAFASLIPRRLMSWFKKKTKENDDDRNIFVHDPRVLTTSDPEVRRKVYRKTLLELFERNNGTVNYNDINLFEKSTASLLYHTKVHKEREMWKQKWYKDYLNLQKQWYNLLTKEAEDPTFQNPHNMEQIEKTLHSYANRERMETSKWNGLMKYTKFHEALDAARFLLEKKTGKIYPRNHQFDTYGTRQEVQNLGYYIDQIRKIKELMSKYDTNV
jgi:hypothetical protein